MKQTDFSSGELMKRINDAIEKDANSKLQLYGVTVAQFHMLLTLHFAPNGSYTLKELEKHFRVAQSTAAGIAMRLEKKKLVSSFTDADDKRVKHIQITDSGTAICENFKECIAETEQRLLSGLTQEEQAQLNHLLLKAYQTMNRKDGFPC